MKFERKLLAAAAALLCAGAANAITIIGTTAGGATFNRPLAGSPPAGLSAVGTAVPYSALTFSVETSGVYNFLADSRLATTGSPTWDDFLILYQGSFNPAAALTNALVANDDFSATIGLAGFSVALTAGTTYIAVTTGFANTDAGAYRLSITSAVPEPASWALMALGAVGLVGWRRRAAAAA